MGAAVPLIFAAVLAAQTPVQHGGLDPEFQKYPFNEWLSERQQPPIRWTATAGAPHFSFHQRLVATVELKVDGRDLQERRKGELIYFVQITDEAGARYQNHGGIDLTKLDENVKSVDLQYMADAFVLPGEYQLAAAILDTDTGEHSARQTRFRVAQPKLDFLRAAWERLPTIEFLGNEEPPESWFLPKVGGRLQWAASVRSPARLDVVLNIAAPPPQSAGRQGESVVMAALVPTMRALSETGAPHLATRFQVLDLGRQRAVFDERARGALDWPRLKEAVGQGNTASIDIRALSEQDRAPQFFLQQIRKTLAGSEEQPCALVVLTPPVDFESGADLDPISTEGLPACRVFYVRYRAPARMRPLGAGPYGPMVGRGPFGRRGPMPQRGGGRIVTDRLEQTLKPLQPRVFDVETPDQMTRVFVEVDKALSTK